MSCPICIAPFAAAGAAHPDGEMALTRAAGTCGIPFVVPHYSSRPLRDIAGILQEAGSLFFQLYPPRLPEGKEDILDREYVQKCIAFLRKHGVKGVFVTVDVPVHGNRSLDVVVFIVLL